MRTALWSNLQRMQSASIENVLHAVQRISKMCPFYVDFPDTIIDIEECEMFCCTLATLLKVSLPFLIQIKAVQSHNNVITSLYIYIIPAQLLLHNAVLEILEKNC